MTSMQFARPAGSTTVCSQRTRRSARVVKAFCQANGHGFIGAAARCAAGVALTTSLLLVPTGSSWANREKVGEFAASGFLFKDNVEVTAVDDDVVPGVTIYISDFKRSLADKLSKDFFAEPSQASLTCALTGPLQPLTAADEDRMGGREGKEVFSERKGLSIFKDKTLRVRRIFDPDRKVIVYVAYSTRLTSAGDEGVSTGRYRTSLCAIPLPAPTPAVEVAAAVDP